MRRAFMGILCVGVLIVLLISANSESEGIPSPVTPSAAPVSSPTPPPQSLDVTHNEQSYRIAWILVPHPSELNLLPNFSQKRTARSLVDTNECHEVVNGGFYTPDYQPTGLFMTEGATLRQAIPNPLLHGYFTIDPDYNASIRNTPPDGPVRLALQTGPVLIRQGFPVKLAIRDDEYARRIGLAVTNNESIVFFTLYDPENTWSGPKLADTPYLLSPFVRHLKISDAINLDGGSASAFIRNDFSLQELTAVGSFFCIR